ncbi:MAG: hypothetical protein RQM92_09410 [Candidatus Syntrophopropionicum ammoniitolerans]
MYSWRAAQNGPGGIGIIAWPDEIEVVKKYSVADIREALPGGIVPGVGDNTIVAEDMEIVHDHFGDIPALWGYDIGLGYVSTKSPPAEPYMSWVG